MSSPSAASCQILGNLTKEPDFRRTAKGSPICDLTVAVNHRGSNGQEKTSFIEITVWGKTAENCRQYLSKGSKIYVEGYLDQDRWQDRNTGANKSKLKIVAEKVLFLSSGNSRNNEVRESQEPAEQEGYQYPPERQGVDPQSPYVPEYKPRFYGDTGARSQIVTPAPVTPNEPVQDDIPF
jgi:single-strand DNA-binding protein